MEATGVHVFACGEGTRWAHPLPASLPLHSTQPLQDGCLWDKGGGTEGSKGLRLWGVWVALGEGNTCDWGVRTWGSYFSTVARCEELS